ncbi:MAG: hypothetical protein P8J87_14935 [Verrucomicrobiales bacterium]|nr:hypothetical protein [Verrucomicrobiales bacterium]
MKLLPASLIAFVAACGGGVAQDGQEVAGSLPTKTLAIVEDGESWYYEGLKKVVLAELKSLSVGQYELELQSSAGNYDGDAIEGRLQAALGDPAVDAVYAAGTIATMRAFSLAKEAAEPVGGKLAKPVMAGAVRFRKEVDLEDVDQEEVGSISSEMTSTIPNYTFVTSPRRVIADLTLLKELTGASRVPVLVDGLVLRELPEEVRDSFEFLKSGETVAETLRGIPADVKNL